MRSNTVPFPVVLLVALLACQALFTAVLAQNETASVSIVTMGYTPVGDTLADTGVKAKDYPNVALISIKTKTGQTTTCTGLIIQVDKVPVLLTAAHCASDSTRKNSAISVVIGLDTESQFSTMCDTKDFPTCRKFKTLKIIQHPMYGHPKCDPQGTVDTMGYDVALWVLTPKNKNIPLKIDSKYLRINDKTSVPPSSSDVPITAIGWGQINVGNAQMMKAAATSFVHKTDLTLRKDPSECEKLYKLCPGSGPRFACVSNKAGDSTCNGDSGGPLYYKDLVWAITSFGSSKCGDGKPGVVLRTSGFYHWVQVTLKEINSDKEFLASQKA
ncbi:trypsin-like serine protease [Gonapodya prolifera JEL478]|uniref:Trypsin-like serine protease n=1 Tax=Gonapodya prolifera (strain JEL478) TaxID=1344416 RepID=A0A139ATB7_GONPJ|nr:trypsin-like serine protease [Gonapodya prolifera JEL478]|eukprot:KXS19980.1 trypsin-like serine protease [Gonapodya prolifera JEL478]